MQELSARLIYLTEEFSFDEKSRPVHEGKIAPATIEGDMVVADVPKQAVFYYIEFRAEMDGKEVISTTAWAHKDEREVG